MPTSVLRHSAGLRMPAQNYPFVSSPWALTGMQYIESGALTITPGSSGSWGSWTQALASTAADAHGVGITYNNTGKNAAAGGQIMEIGLGASPSSALWTAEIGGTAAFDAGASSHQHFIPIRIPAGSEIRVRCAAQQASPTTAGVNVSLWRLPSSSWTPPLSVDTYGVSGSTGTAINADNTWTEITSGLTRSCQGLVPTFGLNDASSGAGTSAIVELGVGAASSETVIAHMACAVLGSEVMTGPLRFVPGCVGGRFAAGTRVAMRSSSGATNVLSAIVIGIPYT